jgi:hypothetical protein
MMKPSMKHPDDEAITFQEMVKAYARTSKDQATIFLKNSKEITC